MKKTSDRLYRPDPPSLPGRLGLQRASDPEREPVSEYFTLYLLQELLHSIGWRHKH
jgi:hypothetical protein